MDMAVGNLQEHIRIDIHPVAEKTVRLVAAVFKVAFVFRVPGGVDAVTAPDKHDGEPVL